MATSIWQEFTEEVQHFIKAIEEEFPHHDFNSQAASVAFTAGAAPGQKAGVTIRTTQGQTVYGAGQGDAPQIPTGAIPHGVVMVNKEYDWSTIISQGEKVYTWYEHPKFLDIFRIVAWRLVDPSSGKTIAAWGGWNVPMASAYQDSSFIISW